ncbi:MAG: ABC transporter permease [Acidobacteria bacterium]|nr:ABC transporter permease [Acidobacteriota bacterium]MBV9476347.1 ABC transporter permease [Acidobacteriota bacterium]
MIGNYIKLALKVLQRRKFFTFISLFGICLTLVVLMVATAILDNLFSPRAPESRFGRTLCVYTIAIFGDSYSTTGTPGYGFVNEYVRNLPGAEATSAFSNFSGTAFFHQGRKIESNIKRTDGAYWKILDFHFLEGAPFTQEDDDRGNFVAVITSDLRRKLFGGASAIGKTFTVEGQTFRVVGVVPPVPITRIAAFSEIWVPIHTQKRAGWATQMTGEYNGLVLARSTADFPRLRREFAQRLTHFRFEKNYDHVNVGLDTPFEAFARSLSDQRKYNTQTPLRVKLILLAIALLFITLPTMNLVSINLSRILERSSEIGVRKAFGASSRALVGQFLVENVVLTIIGGAFGFALAVAILSALTNADLIPYAVFDVNLRIFLYGVAIAAVFGAISGVYPAWRMSRMHPVNALRGGVQ